jgi:RNA polymerase sigma-70 factor (ECF subfamily)
LGFRHWDLIRISSFGFRISRSSGRSSKKGIARAARLLLSFLLLVDRSQRVNETDEALVLRSQQRDRPAFEELVRRTARLVFSRIVLEVADAHRAEDLAQETFLSAWRNIAQVTDAKGFRTWLLAIAHSVTIDAQRRDHRKKRTIPGGAALTGEFPVLAADPRPGPAQSAEREEERQRVLNVLRALPEEYREPLILRYLGGADYETIGRQLGLSNGSLRGLLNRGMARLREEMKREDFP